MHVEFYIKCLMFKKKYMKTTWFDWCIRETEIQNIYFFGWKIQLLNILNTEYYYGE